VVETESRDVVESRDRDREVEIEMRLIEGE
jgi:hypothetical protein